MSIDFKNSIEKFKGNKIKYIVYGVFALILIFALVKAFGATKVFIEDNAKLRENVEALKKEKDEKIKEIEIIYEKKNKELENNYKMKIYDLQKKYDKKFKELVVQKEAILNEASTPQQKVRLGVNIINDFNSKHKQE